MSKSNVTSVDVVKVIKLRPRRDGDQVVIDLPAKAAWVARATVLAELGRKDGITINITTDIKLSLDEARELGRSLIDAAGEVA